MLQHFRLESFSKYKDTILLCPFIYLEENEVWIGHYVVDFKENEMVLDKMP